MKKWLRRPLALLMVLAMCVTTLPVEVFAYSTSNPDANGYITVTPEDTDSKTQATLSAAALAEAYDKTGDTSLSEVTSASWYYTTSATVADDAVIDESARDPSNAWVPLNYQQAPVVDYTDTLKVRWILQDPTDPTTGVIDFATVMAGSQYVEGYYTYPVGATNDGKTYTVFCDDVEVGSSVLGGTSYRFQNTLKYTEIKNVQETVQEYDVAVDDTLENGEIELGTEKAEAGDTVTFTVTPKDGYTVSSVSVNNGAVSVNPTVNGGYSFVMPAGDVTVSATFEAIPADPTYSVNVTADPEELKDEVSADTITSGDSYVAGTEVTLTAKDVDGYTFSYWSDSNGNTSNEKVWTVKTPAEEVTYTAHYTKNAAVYHTVTFKADGKVVDTVQVEDGQTVDQDSLPAIPNKTGYEGSWGDLTAAITEDTVINVVYTAADVTVTIGENTTPETKKYGETVTLDSEDITIPAGKTFAYWTDAEGRHYDDGAEVVLNEDVVSYDGTAYSAAFTPVYETNRYTVTFKTAEGTILETKTVDYDGTVTAPEVPNRTGYENGIWKNVNDEDDTVDGSDTITNIQENATYVAAYEKKSYTVTTAAAPADAGTTEGDGPYEYEATAELTATANTNYDFAYWSGSDGSYYLSETIEVTVTGDVTYTAHFTQGEYVVKFYSDDKLFDIQTVAKGGTAEPKYTPVKVGYTFKKWGDVNGNDVDLTNITANAEVFAQFEANKYKITSALMVDGVSAEQSGVVVIDPTQEASVGETVTFTVTPDTAQNQKIDYITVTGEDATTGPIPVVLKTVENGKYTYSFTMPADEVAITAYLTTESNYGTVVFADAVTGYVLDSQSLEKGREIKAPTVPEKFGYTFDKWTSDKEGTDEVTFPVEVTEDYAVYYAQYTAKAVTVITGDKTDNSKFFGDTVTLEAPEKDGQTIAYWTDKNGHQYADGETVTLDENVVEVAGNGNLTAAFTPVYEDKQVTVTFQLANGTQVAVKEIPYGSTIASAPTPDAPAGQKFDGWYDENNVAFSTTTSFKADTTFTAQFTEDEYEVKYEVGNDGTSDAADTTAKYGEIVTLPEVTAKEGKTFIGWQSDVDNHVYAAGEKVAITADTTFTAVYSDAEVVVRFFANGYLVNYIEAKAGDTVTTPEIPGVDGKTAKFWAADQSATTGYLPGSEITVSSSVDYYAIYEADEYTVSYDTDDGDPAAIDSVTVNYGEQITLADAPTKSGHKFVGWQDTTGGLTYTAGATVTVTADMTLKAIWSAEAYVVKFVDGQGRLVDYQEVPYGGSYKAPAAPEREGYKFINWKLEGEEDTLAPMESKEVGNWLAGLFQDKVITYVAQWEGEEYTLHISALNAKGKLTYDNGTVKIPDDNVATLKAGTALNLTTQGADDKYVVDDVYYVTEINGALVRCELTPDENGAYDFNMPAGETWLHINYKQNVYSITKTETNTTVTVANSAEVGETVTFTVAANDNYVIDSVLVSYTSNGVETYVPLTFVKTEDGKDVYSFVMPAADVTVTATAVKDQCTVRVLDQDKQLMGYLTVEQGTAIPAATLDEYATQAKRPGYGDVTWKQYNADGTLGTAVDAKYTVNESMTIIAVDEAEEHIVTRADNSSEYATITGTINGKANANEVTIGTLTAATDDVVTLTATPVANYKITGIILRDTASGNVVPYTQANEAVAGEPVQYQFTMPNGNVTVQVLTEAIEYKVTVVETENPQGGTYTINGDTTTNKMIKQGDQVDIGLHVEPGYTATVKATYTTTDRSGKTHETIITGVDGTEIYAAGESTISFTMVEADVKVEIAYSKIDYTVTAQKPEHGTITVDPSTANVGDTVTVTLIGDAGYSYKQPTLTVKSATENIPVIYDSTDENGNQIYTFTMPAADVTVNAEFEPNSSPVVATPPEIEGAKVWIGETDGNNQAFRTGDRVEFTVTPEAGYYIKSVALTDAKGNNLYSTEKFDGYMQLPNATQADYEKLVYGTSDITDQYYSEIMLYQQDGTLASAADKITVPTTYHFTMPSHKVYVHVEMEKIIYSVTTEDAYNGDELAVDVDTSRSGNGTYAASIADAKVGERIYVRATAQTGYLLSVVPFSVQTADGKEINVDYLYSSTNKVAIAYFTMPAADVTVEANYVKDSFTVTGADNANGVIKVPADADSNKYDFEYQSEATFQVAPNNGYKITSIVATDASGAAVALTYDLGDGTQPVSGTFTMPKYDVTIVATYTQIGYTVTNQTTDTNGTVTVPTGEIPYQSTATVTVTPATGYMIDTVTATYTDETGKTQTITFTGTPSDLEKGGDYTFIMPAANVDFVATFKQITRNVEVVKTGSAAIRVDGVDTTTADKQYGDTVTVTVTPDAGWQVADVTVTDTEGNNKVDLTAQNGKSGGDYTFTMPEYSVKVNVILEKINYAVTGVINPTNTGTIKLAKGASIVETAGTTSLSDVNVGDIVTATVAEKYGYKLVHVEAVSESGDTLYEGSTTGTFTFVMPAENVTVTATFTEEIYTVTFMDWNGDMLKVDEVPYLGDATPPEDPSRTGYTFTGWDVSYEEITEDTVVTATYEVIKSNIDTDGDSFTGEDRGSITMSNSEHGDVSIDGQTAAYGDKVVFKVDPDDGWRVDYVSVIGKDGTSIPVSKLSEDAYYVATYTFVMPEQDVSIRVYYKEAASSAYTDVRTDHWFYDAVNFVTDRGYFYGIDEGIFGPKINMNRAMFVTVLGRIDGVDVSQYQGSSFSDVKADSYYGPYVEWASQNGIVSGYGNGKFGPNDSITREQMASIMMRYCRYLGIDTSIENADWMDRYTDSDKISSYAKDSVAWAVGTGLMLGMSNTTIDPKSNATRAQVAQIIKNLCDKILYQ
ncbi:MAG: InlB B-repeat-containing protein [Eubacteriales bacterium]|nr:InlB B-repeat-containing protein [Eubacteriales bacterium]